MVRSHYAGSYENEEWDYLHVAELFDEAIRWLATNGLIEVLKSDFGRPVIFPKDDFQERLLELQEDKALPFRTFSRLSNGEPWLREQLEGANPKYAELGLMGEDLKTGEIEWSPIPLDRSDPELPTAISTVENAVELVRGNNGYAATHPVERASIIARLEAFVRHPKVDATITLHFIRESVLASLKTLSRRFIDHPITAAGRAAWLAVADWLARRGINIGPP